MKQFRLMVSIPQIVLVNAETEEQAIETAKKNFLQKPADMIEIKVISDIEEAKEDNLQNS